MNKKVCLIRYKPRSVSYYNKILNVLQNIPSSVWGSLHFCTFISCLSFVIQILSKIKKFSIDSEAEKCPMHVLDNFGKSHAPSIIKRFFERKKSVGNFYSFLDKVHRLTSVLYSQVHT